MSDSDKAILRKVLIGAGIILGIMILYFYPSVFIFGVLILTTYIWITRYKPDTSASRHVAGYYNLHTAPAAPATVQVIPPKPEGYSVSDVLAYLNYGQFPGHGTYYMLVHDERKRLDMDETSYDEKFSLSVYIYPIYLGKPSGRTGMLNMPPLPGAMNCLDYSNLLIPWLKEEIFSGTPIGPLKTLSSKLLEHNMHDTWRKLDICINNYLGMRRDDGMSFWEIENYAKCAQYFLYELTDGLSAYKYLDRLRMCYEKMGELEKAIALQTAILNGKTGVVPSSTQIDTLKRSINRLQKLLVKKMST